MIPTGSIKQRKTPATRRAAQAAFYLSKFGLKAGSISFDNQDGFRIELADSSIPNGAESDWDDLLGGRP